ncbi:MAG TPA: hypothetical protein PLU53_06115 [Bacteroidia bacterium]|nr:hypothetical protein [Bacteroidia bacterium]
MYRISILIILFQLLSGVSFQSAGQSVPVFKGTTADNKPMEIPTGVTGSYTLLCFASSPQSQTDLETWLEPVYNHYIAKTGIMDAAYDVNVFFIPVFKGANATMKSALKKKFRENAQADLWGHILFCDNDLSAVEEKLNMSKGNVPYFFLLDKSGQIVFRTSGAYSEEKFDAMDDKIE